MPNREELKKARSLALRYLSYRDRSRHEIIAYLAQKDFSESAIEQTMDRLNELGYVNDERFALNWGRYRISKKKYGEHRLRRELQAKGLEAEIIHQSLTTLYSETDPKALALSCAEKKLAGLRGIASDKKKRRLAQFLQRQGFSSETVFHTVNRLLSADREEGDGLDDPSSQYANPKTHVSGDRD